MNTVCIFGNSFKRRNEPFIDELFGSFGWWTAVMLTLVPLEMTGSTNRNGDNTRTYKCSTYIV